MKQTAEDIAREDAVAAHLAAAWGCVVHRFPPLCPVDYYAERDGVIIAVIEIKSISHSSDDRPHCWIDAHKLLRLDFAALGLGVPAIYVNQFTDRTLSVRVADIDRTPARVIGRQDRGRDERRPAIRVPIWRMKVVR